MRLKSTIIPYLTEETIAQIAKGNKAIGKTIAEDGTITLFRESVDKAEYLVFVPSFREGQYRQLLESWRELPYLPSDMVKIE